MSNSESFGENPFRSLAAGKFPDKDKKRQPGNGFAQDRSRRISHAGLSRGQTATAGGSLDTEDCELFLNAVGLVCPAGKGGAKRKKKNTEHSGTFLFEEHCSLPCQQSTNKGKKNNSVICAAARKNSSEPEKNSLQGRGLERPGMKKNIGKPGHACKIKEICADAAEENGNSSRSEDEDAIFMQAMGQVQPLQGRGRDIAPAPEAGTPPPQGQLSLQDFMEGKLEFALSFTDEYIEGHVVGLDQMIMNKLRAGSLSPEGHLDLHGLNAVQAFEALRGFLRGSWYKGLRTVLVVPGRGRNSPDGIGILREKLQLWLTQEPLKRVVLAFCTAQPHDGGAGSVYVLLRKYRKKGRIYWERLPADSDLY